MLINNEEMFRPRVVVKGVLGGEEVTYETWLIRGGLKYMVGNSLDREFEQIRANEIFTFFKGSVPGLTLQDFVNATTMNEFFGDRANPISDQLPTSSLPSQGGKF